jgi:hypothetical protein
LNYEAYRKGLTQLDYVDSVYVELRDGIETDEIVAFFCINDKSLGPDSIESSKFAVWDSTVLRRSLMNALNAIKGTYFVYSDNKMSLFHVHNYPYQFKVFSLFNEIEYIHFIESLGRPCLSGRSAAPPKYPHLLPPYSVWHYKLDWSCKCRDIDYFEIRENKVKAILEVTGKLKNEEHLKRSINPMSPRCIFKRLSLQKKILHELSNKLSINAYFVIHTEDLNVFYIFDYDFNNLNVYNKEEYTSWLNSL